MLKFIFTLIFSLSLIGLEKKAQAEVYDIVHPHWQEKLEITDYNFKSKVGNKGKILKLNDDVIVLIWERYPAELFVYDPIVNKWKFLRKDDSYRIQSEYEELVYSLDEPYIKLNPFGKTPLAALVKFPTDTETKITIRIKGKENSPDIVHTIDAYETEHDIPIFGLYPNHKNEVLLTAEDKNGNKKSTNITIQTGGIDIDEQWITLQKKDDSFNYYATYDGHVYDEYGSLRYQFIDGGWHQVYFYKDFVFVETQGSVKKYSLLGKLLREYVYPKGFYGYIHGIGFKNNDNLLVFGSFENSKALIDNEMRGTHRDFVLEIDITTGDILKKYDLAEMLNPDRSLIIKSTDNDGGKIDWAHTNGIDYDAKNKAVIVSGRHIGIVKISEKSKKPIWWLTPHQLTHKSGRNGDKGDISHLLLTAVDKNKKPYSKKVQKGIEKADGFKWPLKTHNVKYIGNGLYSILDNSGEMYDKSLYTTKNSVASVFKIDDKAKTVQQMVLKELPAYSEMGSAIIIHPQTKELWVSLGKVASKNGGRQCNTHMYRFDSNKNIIYEALIHKGDNSMIYLIHPYQFYSKNNWPTPQK